MAQKKAFRHTPKELKARKDAFAKQKHQHKTRNPLLLFTNEYEWFSGQYTRKLTLIDKRK